jgi:TatD DNase family protein
MEKTIERVPFEPEYGIPLIDAHCHLPWEEKGKQATPSAEDCYSHFIQSNGQLIISSTIDWQNLATTLKFAVNKKIFKIAVGWAPQTITYTPKSQHETEFRKWLKWITEHSTEYLAIGEIGLDFHHAKLLERREQQVQCFKEIISKTKFLGKSYMLHVRNAGNNECDPQHPNHPYDKIDAVNQIILDILQQEGISPSRIMWHCFSGPAEWGEKLAQQGFIISVPSSAFGFKKWRKNIEKVPLEQLLTETDSPFQHPYNFGGFNSPENVKYAIAAIAYVTKVDQQKVATQILENCRNFFKITC